MSDVFLPGSGFDTYEAQDKALIMLDGGAACAAAVRILQQQGFRVTGAALRLTNDSAGAVSEAKRAAKHLGIECVTLDARRLYAEADDGAAAAFTALLAAADNLKIQYVSAGMFARVELDSAGESHIAPCASAADDESARLAGLPQEVLARLLLPLGEFSRADAEEMLAVLERGKQ